MVTSHNLAAIGDGTVDLECQFTERRRSLPAATIVMVTSRAPDDALYHDLMADPKGLADAGIKDVSRVGDCFSPGTIAAAVYSGHRFARDLTLALTDTVPFAVESIAPTILASPKSKRARRAS